MCIYYLLYLHILCLKINLVLYHVCIYKYILYYINIPNYYFTVRTGNPNIFSGKATLISKSKSVLNYQAESRLPGLFSRMIPTTGLYHIMYSDYHNYTILWSCTSFGLFHTGKVNLMYYSTFL